MLRSSTWLVATVLDREVIVPGSSECGLWTKDLSGHLGAGYKGRALDPTLDLWN